MARKDNLTMFQGIIDRSKEVGFSTINKTAFTGTTNKGYTVCLAGCSCPAQKSVTGHVVVKTQFKNVLKVCKHVVALARECGLPNLAAVKDAIDGIQSIHTSTFGTVPAKESTAAPTVQKAKPQLTFKYDKYRAISWIQMSYTSNEVLAEIQNYAKERSLNCAIVPINGLTEILLSSATYTTPADSYGLMMRLAYHLMELGYQVATKG